MIFGVIPCDPRSLYWVHGRIIDNSMTGCIVMLFGGSSLRTFGAFGAVSFGASVVDVAAAAAAAAAAA